MSLLDEISEELIHAERTPQFLYIQRHLYNDLLDELERATGGLVQDVKHDTIFGVPVVWVQHDNHPNVRAI